MVTQTDRKVGFLSREIADLAKARLQTHPYPSIRRVACECNSRGQLFLRGCLPSFYQKQLAQEAVSGLPGVTQVVNETEVAR